MRGFTSLNIRAKPLPLFEKSEWSSFFRRRATGGFGTPCAQSTIAHSQLDLIEGVSGMYVLKLLKKDHFTVQSLFSKFDRSGKSSHEKRGELFVQIRRELQIHSRAEEEIFYPALKALSDDGRRLVSEAVKEHKDID